MLKKYDSAYGAVVIGKLSYSEPKENRGTPAATSGHQSPPTVSQDWVWFHLESIGATDVFGWIIFIRIVPRWQEVPGHSESASTVAVEATGVVHRTCHRTS